MLEYAEHVSQYCGNVSQVEQQNARLPFPWAQKSRRLFLHKTVGTLRLIPRSNYKRFINMIKDFLRMLSNKRKRHAYNKTLRKTLSIKRRQKLHIFFYSALSCMDTITRLIFQQASTYMVCKLYLTLSLPRSIPQILCLKCKISLFS